MGKVAELALAIKMTKPKQPMQVYRHLSAGERHHIQCLLQQGMNAPEIAASLNRDPSSIRREIARNTFEGFYDGQRAHAAANRRRHRANAKIKGWVLDYIMKWLKRDHSPQQICARLRRFHRRELTAAAVYRFIWRDYAHGGKMWKLLRYCGRAKRLRHYGKGQRALQARRRDRRRSIHERGARIDNHREYGHWEMDLVEGKGRRRFLLVLLERKSRYVCAGLIREKSPAAVAKVAKRLLRRFKVKSITTDNGVEFSTETVIEQAVGCPLYFTDAYASWQKGQIEHVNGLLRQYFRKSDSLEAATNRNVKRATGRINERLREILGWLAPEELSNHLKRDTPISAAM
ncbi:MAG: IS30 family transposase [Verrucomicrobiota bacterium]